MRKILMTATVIAVGSIQAQEAAKAECWKKCAGEINAYRDEARTAWSAAAKAMDQANDADKPAALARKAMLWQEFTARDQETNDDLKKINDARGKDECPHAKNLPIYRKASAQRLKAQGIVLEEKKAEGKEPDSKRSKEDPGEGNAQDNKGKGDDNQGKDNADPQGAVPEAQQSTPEQSEEGKQTL